MKNKNLKLKKIPNEQNKKTVKRNKNKTLVSTKMNRRKKITRKQYGGGKRFIMSRRKGNRDRVPTGNKGSKKGKSGDSVPTGNKGSKERKSVQNFFNPPPKKKTNNQKRIERKAKRKKEKEEKEEAIREADRKEREADRKERKEEREADRKMFENLLGPKEETQKGVFQSFKDYFKNLPKNTKEGFQKGLINLPSNTSKGFVNGIKGIGTGTGKILGSIGENFLEGFFQMSGFTNLMNLAEAKKGNRLKKKGTSNDKILYNQLEGLKQLEDSMISIITENNIEKKDMKKFKLRNFKEILESLEGHSDTSYELLKNQTEFTNNFSKLDTIFDFFKHTNSLGIDKTEFDKEIETLLFFLKPTDKSNIENDVTAITYLNEVKRKKERINEFFLNTNPIKISLYKYLKQDDKYIYKITNTLMLLYRKEIKSYFDDKVINKYYTTKPNFSNKMDYIKKLFLKRVKKQEEEEKKIYILNLLNKESEEPTSSTPPEKSEAATVPTSSPIPTESSTSEDDIREEKEIIKRKALLVAKTITILLSVKEIEIKKKKKTFLNKLLYREDSFSQEYLLFLIILGNDFSKLNESLRESYLNDTTDNLYKFYNKLLNKFNRINNRIKPIKGEYDNIIGFFDYNKIIKYLLDKLSLKYSGEINILSSKLFSNIHIPAILNREDLYYKILPKLEENFKTYEFNNYIYEQILNYELRKIEDIRDEATELEKIKERMETLYTEFQTKCNIIKTILEKLQEKKVIHFIKLLENVIKRKPIEPFPFISVIGVFIDIDYIIKTINNKIKKKDKTVIREIRKTRNTLDFLKITDKEFYNSLISDISEIEEKKGKPRKSKPKKYMKNIFENNSYITIIINILKNLLSTKNLISLFHLNIINLGILSGEQDIDIVYLTKEKDKKQNNELKNKQYISYFKDLIFNKIPSENEIYKKNTYGDYTRIIKTEVENDRSIRIKDQKDQNLTQKIKKNILYQKLEESIKLNEKGKKNILDFLIEQIKSNRKQEKSSEASVVTPEQSSKAPVVTSAQSSEAPVVTSAQSSKASVGTPAQSSKASVGTQEQSQDIKASVAIVAKILNTNQVTTGGSRKKRKKSKRNKRKIKYPRTKKAKKSKKKKTIEYINNKNYRKLSKKVKRSKKKKTLEYINNKNYLKLTKKK